MKKYLVWVAAFMVSAALCRAEGLKLGVHGAYSVGGDVEDESFGYGAQVGAAVNENLSLELSGTMFQDQDEGIDMDITTIAFSARLGGELADNVGLYVGGGANYNMFDMDDVAGVKVDIDDVLGYHFCGGLELSLADSIELFGEYRYSMVELDEATIGGETGDINEDYNFGLVRVGLNFIL